MALLGASIANDDTLKLNVATIVAVISVRVFMAPPVAKKRASPNDPSARAVAIQSLVVSRRHYAGSSTGICIQYRARALLAGLDDGVTLVRLSYDDKPPFITTRDSGDYEQAVRKIFSQKKQNWVYEREWRILGALGKNAIADGDCISRIYFGSQISTEDKTKLTAEFRPTGIQLYRMRIDGYDYVPRKLVFPKRTVIRKKLVRKKPS